MTSLLTQFFFIPRPSLTEKNCPEQKGRVFIVTGGYAGVGFELSQILFSHNATVYIAGRSRSKASGAVERIKKAFPESAGCLEIMDVDLSDQSTIKPAVQAFLARENRLDVLVNNAAVMYPPAGSKDPHNNDLQLSTNCLGPYLLHKLLQPLLAQTASLAPTGTVRVLWAASSAVDVFSPKPNGMELDERDGDRPRELGVKLDYGQSKVGNVFLARHYAAETTHLDPEAGVVVHAAFNPGNLRTELQRHWKGLQPRLVDLFLLHPPIYGAYTELWAALSPELTPDLSGAYVLPWGRVGGFRAGVEAALKPVSEGGTGVAARFVAWCEKQTLQYV